MEKIGINTPYVNNFAACLGAIILLCGAPLAFSQESRPECDTVKKCAQQMVQIATDLTEKNRLLGERISQLESQLDSSVQEVRVEWQEGLAEIKTRGGENFVQDIRQNGRTNLCPAGQYMVGATYYNVSGGCCGVTANFGVICRSF